MELVEIDKAPSEFKEELIKLLGYVSDGVHVRYPNGELVRDPYTDDVITLDNMSIFPIGKKPFTRVLLTDSSIMSTICLFEDYPELAED